jgi:precorrin-2 dehydrogenase/sirohydrochlorin ferrochelatase
MTPAREDGRHGCPVVLRLRGRRVLVVGGGRVAARRAAGLLAAGARVVAVSRAFSPGFARLEPAGGVTRVRRAYRTGDVAGASLVVAATDDPRVNARVRADARRAGVWVNVADDPARSDFIVPAVVRRGGFLLALSSGGASPALMGELRRELDRLVPDDVAVFVANLAKARDRIRRHVPDPAERRDALGRLLAPLRGLLAPLGRLQAPLSRRAPRAGRPASGRTRRRPARAGRRPPAARTPASPRTGSRRSGTGAASRAARAADAP